MLLTNKAPETDACARSIDQSNFEDSWKDDFVEFAWVPADFARNLKLQRDALLHKESRLNLLCKASDSALRLMFGEMTAQEIRTVRAAINYIQGSEAATGEKP